MAIDRQERVRGTRPWWRPLACSTAAAAAIAALFNPLPAAAAPQIPPPAVPAVPDPGSRPIPLGTLVMPGQNAAGPAAPGTVPAASGVAMSPLLQRIEKQRAEIATLGDKLIRLGEDRDLAQQQLEIATKRVADADSALVKAQQEAAAAAAAALRAQAALPPGTVGSGLAELDALSRMQRGETATEEAAARQLVIVQATRAAALSEQATAGARATDLTRQYDELNAEITKKQTALQDNERQHADEITAAEAAESAEDRRLGEGYLDGTAQGRGADPRAVAALTYALAQRGKPYEWSEEGPDSYDCSGLMWDAYRQQAAGTFPLMRVSRDQYWQTRNKVVDRYSLLPGDLLFFSSTNSWTGIHHVAMYAGDGMMVEAPRTGLNVRLVPVRWTRLFQATRIYGSVNGPTETPDLSAPPPNNGEGPATTRPATKPPTTTPAKPGSKPPTSPSRSPSASPTRSPSTAPSSATPSSTGTSSSSAPSPSTSSSSSSPTGSTSTTTTAPTSTKSTSTTTSAPESTSTATSAPEPTSTTRSAAESTSTTSAPESTSTTTSAPEPSSTTTSAP